MSSSMSVLYSPDHYAVSVMVQVHRGDDCGMYICRVYDSTDKSCKHMWENVRKDILHIAKTNGGSESVRIMVNNHGKFEFYDYSVAWSAEHSQANKIQIVPILF